MSGKPEEPPPLAFSNAASWERWLDENHDDAPGVWVKFAKKSSGVASLTYPEAVDGALCYGWIDGQTKGFDGTYWLQRYTPRRARSRWSKINRDRVALLIEAGRMRPAGLGEVERAKSDGRWQAAYDSPKTATVPEDLRRELDASPKASEVFEALGKSRRYQMLYQIQDAKKPETRVRRIARYLAELGGENSPG